ncbi:MAG: type pilus assembly protein PilA [Candidatus Sumerlaeota bacterium]|nr:type pilus assembly protein PilA [Candidatus Sumerlaeota bacterium]
MRKLQGFTLIELLIVVAIIAILAAIAVPNFLEAQVRSKVSRVKSDHRSLATAIEAYYVDNNIYPAVSMDDAEAADAIVTTDNKGRTFRLRNATQLSTITSPVAYITSYFGDAFADTRGLPFRYSADRAGWILGSFGPDGDEGTGGDLQWADGTTPYAARVGTGNTNDAAVETIYDSRKSQPSDELIAGESGTAGFGAYTYDPTNGTVSQGDVWRVKE